MCELTKVCKGECGLDLCLCEFPNHFKRLDGKSNYCKLCTAKKRKSYQVSGIYKITSPSGRVYIGQSVDLRNRINGYKSTESKYSGQPILWRSFKKHGIENHIFEIIEQCEPDELDCRERYWQDYYDVLNGGLNCILTECGDKKRIESVKTRENKRNVNLGKKFSAEHKKRIGESKIGIPRSEKTKDKLREANLCGKTENSIKVIDVITKDTFDCIVEAAKSIDINPITLSGYLKNPDKNKTNFIYLSEYVEDEVYFDKKFVENRENYKIINTETLEIYDNFAHAAKSLGLGSAGHFGAMMKGEKLNTTACVFVRDYVPGMKIIKPKGGRIKVLNLKTGEVYKSIKVASKVNQIDYDKLRKELQTAGVFKHLKITE